MWFGGVEEEGFSSSTWVIQPHSETFWAGYSTGLFLRVYSKNLDLCFISVVLSPFFF